MTPRPTTKWASLVSEVRRCTQCAPQLPLGPRPVFQFDPAARILIVGQAPGRKVHETGLPFNDPSGDRLRDWLGVDHKTFYDAQRIALLPMGFCYPGTGRSGDLPPRPECAATWRAPLLAHLRQIRLTLVIGQYAIAWHLPHERGTLTQTVQAWTQAAAGKASAADGRAPRQESTVIPLPHPSPRNNLWLRRNPWFDSELLPRLREQVAAALSGSGAPGLMANKKT